MTIYKVFIPYYYVLDFIAIRKWLHAFIIGNVYACDFINWLGYSEVFEFEFF